MARSGLELPDLGAAAWLGFMLAIVQTQLWVMLAWLYFRCSSAVEANGLLARILGLRPHPGAAIAPLELWIVAIVAIDHTLGSGAWRLQIPRHWARAVAWGGTGTLLAAGLAAMPLVRRPFIDFQF
jgi:hypothetical protein